MPIIVLHFSGATIGMKDSTALPKESVCGSRRSCIERMLYVWKITGRNLPNTPGQRGAGRGGVSSLVLLSGVGEEDVLVVVFDEFV